MRLITLVLLFLMSFNVLAVGTPIATVTKMRGIVTKLLPGTLEASLVAEGDKFPEDTSVVTGPKSFVKIKFVDNSELSIGPDSKIVISEMGPSSVGIISLLKGRVRTEVQKAERAEDRKENKFYIRTRTAALGVRGTDFQTIYNPDNRMTSLLTYNGAVAMAKIDESTHQKFEGSKTTVVRDEADPKKAPEIKVIPGKPVSEKEELVKVLASNETVLVPPGQTTFASDSLKKSSQPVKISPVQLNALYKNREFDEKNLVNVKSGLETGKDTQAIIPTAAQKAPAEGFYNAKTGDYAPKAGGFIDQNTGLYVAPDASAVYNEKLGVYVTERAGDVDADTGQYVAPKGVILDAKKGFIIDPTAEVKPELLALREDLNRSIARDIVVGDLDGEVQMATRNLNERFIRNKLSFSLSKGNEKIALNEGESNFPYSSTKADPFKISALWQVSSTNRFAPLLGLSFTNADFDDLSSSNSGQDSKSLFGMLVGLKYALTNRVDLFTALTLDQAHYANQTASFPTSYLYKKIVITKLNLGVNAELIRSNRWSLMGDLSGKIGFRKRYNNLVVSSNSGFNLRLAPQYMIDERKSIALGFYVGRESVELSNNVGFNKQKRKESGLELRYNIELL